LHFGLSFSLASPPQKGVMREHIWRDVTFSAATVSVRRLLLLHGFLHIVLQDGWAASSVLLKRKNKTVAHVLPRPRFFPPRCSTTDSAAAASLFSFILRQSERKIPFRPCSLRCGGCGFFI
jgi:hypothetical protein